MTIKEKEIIIDNAIKDLKDPKDNYWNSEAKNEILEIAKDLDNLDKNRLIAEINNKSINANLTQKTVLSWAIVIVSNLNNGERN